MMITQENTTFHKRESVIQARGLTRKFGALTAVNRLDIDIYRSEVFGFLGPNGAGKSTTIRMLVGLMLPTEGSAQVLGVDIPKEANKLRSKIGYMTQKFSLYEDLSVKENLDFAAQIYGIIGQEKKARIDEILEDFDLTEMCDKRPAVMSGGWKQRLALATSMIHKPELLFLDEPTSGVDPGSRRLFWKKLFELAARGTTILVSTHYMDEAVRCHRICMLQDGCIKAVGAPADLTLSLKGRIVELKADPLEKAMTLIQTQPFVEIVTQLGNKAHVLLTPDAPSDIDAARQLFGVLQNAGFDRPKAEAAEPNLEDVFVTHTQCAYPEEEE
jgi:ABC-2 type transport system ATP-binding protein